MKYHDIPKILKYCPALLAPYGLGCPIPFHHLKFLATTLVRVLYLMLAQTWTHFKSFLLTGFLL